jgi:carbon monoxide dehydrogenase subunit G
MCRPRLAGCLVAAIAVWLCGSCSKGPSVNWSAQENFFAVEESEKTDQGARLEFHSLVDAPAPQVYRALADPEHYADFIEGVSESALVSAEGDTKVTQITQSVIGRQSRARVKWTLHPEERKIEFETLQSDANYNDGSYQVFSSPDGKRSYIVSVYFVKEKGAPQNVPIGVLMGATRDSFERAAHSVKRRALGQPGKG